MGFKKFKTLDEVLTTYQLSIKNIDFLSKVAPVSMPSILKEDIEYITKNFPYNVSEAAIRETIMFPVLKEIWRRFDDSLMLWSNKSIMFDKELGGMPDYMVTKQSPLGKVVFDKPLLAVVEAKKDDFAGGWAQCVLELYAIQKLNNRTDVPVYGVVSNGDTWEFGKLENTTFYENDITFSLRYKDELFSVLVHFFELCKTSALMHA